MDEQSLSTPFSGFLVFLDSIGRLRDPTFNSLFGIPTSGPGYASTIIGILSTPFSGFLEPVAVVILKPASFNSLFGIQYLTQLLFRGVEYFQLPFRDSGEVQHCGSSYLDTLSTPFSGFRT